jgi:RNA polymerase sigma factor (sigma-70 family)
MSPRTPGIPPIAELYRTYARRVFNLACRMTGNRDTAEDVLQEVFIRVLEHADSFRGESSIYTWIVAIARNVCLKSKKRSFRAIEKLMETEAEPLRFDDDLERRYYIQQVKDGCLTGLLRCLSFHQRVAFILGVLYGVPAKTVAQVLQKSENSVRILMFRARANVRAFLCENCSLYDRANKCRCENMVRFSLKNGWIAQYGSGPSPRVIESELKQLKNEVLLYQSLLEQDPPPLRLPSPLKRTDLKLLSARKVK